MDTLANIKKWINVHSSCVLDQLEGPANNEEIKMVESVSGVKLPVEFKKLLQNHNGEQGSFLSLLGDGNELLSCAGILERYAYERDHCEISHNDQLQIQEWKELAIEEVISVKGPVFPHESHSKWVPITSMNGDTLRYIDYDPAPSGVIGQVIEVDQQQRIWEVIAPSFRVLLEQYLNDLENDHYYVNDHGHITKKDQYIEEIESWGIPAWLNEFSNKREMTYEFNDDDWHLDLRNFPQTRVFLNKTYPMELELRAWQNYLPSQIDNDYYDISWTEIPGGLYIAFAHKSIFNEIVPKIKTRSLNMDGIPLKITLTKHDEPTNKKAHPNWRCWLEATEVILLN